MKKGNGGGWHPRPIGSAVEGFTRRTPPVVGYGTERHLRRAPLRKQPGAGSSEPCAGYSLTRVISHDAPRSSVLSIPRTSQSDSR
jgi:hypothetical protein